LTNSNTRQDVITALSFTRQKCCVLEKQGNMQTSETYKKFLILLNVKEIK